jgi:hypothetical protein
MGRAIAEASKRQPLTEEARVQNQGAIRERIGRYSLWNINQVLNTDVSVQLVS